ncbi:MAG: quinol:cytochrome C oxidoreductase, partial [Phycisphaerales bacterium]
VGWMVSVGLCLGALFFVLLQHMTRSGWSVSIRRLAEGIAKNLTWLWMLFVPILIMVLKGDGAILYEWGDTHLMETDHLLHAKAGYLSPT